MQLRYVASEFGSGLKRNVSMTVAVILTIWISLSLVGLGLLIRSQIGLIEEELGSRLEVKVVFCAKNSQTPTCIEGEATRDQELAVQETLRDSAYVSKFRYETREAAYKGFVARYSDQDGNETSIADEVEVSDMSTAYWATLASPDDDEELLREVQNSPGVEQVVNLREFLDPYYDTLTMLQRLALGGAALLILASVLQVSNTIRLAAMARRREIGIMRLVGASSIYIQLPFLLEILFAALVGAALACGSLLLVMTRFVPWLEREVRFWGWVDMDAAYTAMAVIIAIAVSVAVIPTLVMTRKYLKV
ncbi:MAG: FtsX-like permease family protein [Nocardioidaceae bacterium]|nr:FtsX-like permease family protein [Nocardioidaceae bacterium]